MDDDAGHEVEFGLLVPFKCCASQGGRYDDASFVAGARWAQARAELQAAPRTMEWSDTIEPDLVGQYELLAMEMGYVMESLLWHGTEWVIVRFVRPEPETEPS